MRIKYGIQSQLRVIDDKFRIKDKILHKLKLSLKEVYAHNAELMSAKFGYEDQLVAAGYSDGKVKIFNVNTNKKLH